jgi:RNA polymerase sigma factor (sigma-70 family)
MVAEALYRERAMAEHRLLRTIAYQRFGIFRAREILVQQGVMAPSDQIAAVACFLETGLARETDLSFVFGPSDAVHAKLRATLERTLADSGSSLGKFLRPLSHLALQVQRFVAWDPFQDFAELLTAGCAPAYSRVAGKLRSRFEVGFFNAADLADQFVLCALPKAVRKFDLNSGRGVETKWLETVFYRYCLKRTLTDLQSRRQLNELQSQRREETEETQPGEPEMPAVLELYEALQQLPEVEQRAVELYYGLQRREHTISELASALSCSEYYARAAVLRGIARLSAILHVHGTLDDEEFRLVRLYFGEGKHLAAAAEDAHLTLDEARRVLVRAQKKFSNALRIRTSPRRLRVEAKVNEKKEIDMRALTEGRVLTTAEILKELWMLKDTPSVRTDEEGHWKVFLDQAWVHLTRVRQVLREEPAILDELEAKAVPLGWLTLPDPAPERADVPDDRTYLQDVFEALARRAYDQARYVATLWLDAAQEKRLPLPDADFDEIVHSVLRVLGGVSQAIETELPRSLRRRGEARFRVDRSERGIRGHWEDSAAESFDVFRLTVHRASLLGDLGGELAEELARVIAESLFESEKGTCILPSFRIAETTSTTAWLVWRSPSLVESLDLGR